MRYLDEPPASVLDGEPPPYYTAPPPRRANRCPNCGRLMALTFFGLECYRCPTHAGGRRVFLAADPDQPGEKSDLEAAAQDLAGVAARRYGLRVQRPHRPSSRGKH